MIQIRHPLYLEGRRNGRKVQKRCGPCVCSCYEFLYLGNLCGSTFKVAYYMYINGEVTLYEEEEEGNRERGH